jgi:hypothetical protein
VSEAHIYLLKAYGKSAQIDLTAAEKKALQHLVKQIKESTT